MSDRIDTLDVMRGIAVCGILVVNILVMGTVGSTQGRIYPAAWNADWVAWGVQRVLFEGQMRGLFTILFGAGMLLMLRKSEGPNGQVAPVDAWTRRCLALLLFGVVHFAVLMWPGEILWTYGIAGLILLAFRTCRVRTLWIWALAIVACLSLVRVYESRVDIARGRAAVAGEQARKLGQEPTARQQAALEAAEAAKAAVYPDPESLAEEVEQRTRFLGLLGWSAGDWAFRHLGRFGWIAVCESLALMLVGMALFRSGILSGDAPARTYWRLLLAGGGIGLALKLADLAWQARTGFELDIHRIDPLMSMLRAAWYQPARLALTLGYVGTIVLLVRAARWWTPPFRAMGRMALTAYTLQSALTSILFYALGYLGAFGAADLVLITAFVCALIAGFSSMWLRAFSMGPAEWLLRAIAYGSFSPLRIGRPAPRTDGAPSL